jgi:hypothetical protein
MLGIKIRADTATNYSIQVSIRTRLIVVILPLSLVWHLLGNLNHPNPDAKLLNLDPPKGLGEKVGDLILGVDVGGLDAPLIQAAPNEVVLNADMLAALIEDGVLRYGQGGLAVHRELHYFYISS